jgi:hypothetical protein
MHALLRLSPAAAARALVLAAGCGKPAPTRTATDEMTPRAHARAATVTGTREQRRAHAMQDVVREQPWMVQAMGNPVLMGALAMVASPMIRNRMGPPSQPRAGRIFGQLF